MKELNVQTGKMSSAPNAFSEPNWGDNCRKYLIAINEQLRPTSFEKIVTLARDHMKPARRGTSQSTATGRLEEDLNLGDQRMHVIDVSDDETCSLSCYCNFLLLIAVQDILYAGLSFFGFCHAP
jgi:hypothetical protein